MADNNETDDHEMDTSAGTYPDLSLVKTEILYFECDENEPDHYEDAPPNPGERVESELVEIHKADSTTEDRTSDNKSLQDHTMNESTSADNAKETIQNTNIETENENNTDEIVEKSTKVSSTIESAFVGNKIILGVKKNKELNINNDSLSEMYEERCFQTKLLVEDWRPYLDKCNCYCESCQILFPTVNSLDYHNMTCHSHLVAIDELEPPPDEQKPQLQQRKNIVKSALQNNFAYQCLLCPSTTNHKANLKRHYITLHKITEITEEMMARRVQVNCVFCNIKLPSQDDLVEHLYKNHFSKQLDCNICSEKFSNKKELEDHLYEHARDNFQNKSMNKQEFSTAKIHNNVIHLGTKPKYASEPSVANKIQFNNFGARIYPCSMCHKRYLSSCSLQRHVERHHKYTKPLRKPETAESSSTPLLNNDANTGAGHTCKLCHKTFETILSLRGHINKVHRGYKGLPKLVIKSKISKGGQFSCKLCEKSFFTSRSLRSHVNSKHRGKKGFVSANKPEPADGSIGCRLCPRRFGSAYSLRSHVNSYHRGKKGLFTAKGSNGIVARDQHHAALDCWYKCKICEHFYSDLRSCKLHLQKAHNSNWDSSKIIKVWCRNQKTMKPGAVKNDKHTEGPTVVCVSALVPRNVVFKCRLCNVHCQSYSKALHDLSHSDNVECEKCNLLISRDFVTGHNFQHKNNDSAMRVIRADKDDALDDTILAKCPLCEVHFKEKTIHDHFKRCDGVSKDCTYCPVCKLTLVSSTADAHDYHHKAFGEEANFLVIKYIIIKSNSWESPKVENSEQSVLLQRYHSLIPRWNVLFLCGACDVVSDSYSYVVEHCQNHILDKNVDGSTSKCNVCDLNFEDDCYEKHYKLHISNKSVNRQSFSILKYDYASLTKWTWLDELFSPLPNVNPNDFVSHSVYKYTRSVRFEVTDGSPEYTVYLCAQCQTAVPNESVGVHTGIYSDGDCVNIEKKYQCRVCRLAFLCLKDRRVHETFHDKVDGSPYRVVTFNKSEHAADNKILKNATRTSTSEYVLYVCRNCGLSVEPRAVTAHLNLYQDCGERMDEYAGCARCGLLFSKKDLPPHAARHDDPAFDIDSVKILYFGTKKVSQVQKAEPQLQIERGKKYKVYRCNRCGNCLLGDYSRHHCTTRTRTCDMCQLQFSATGYRAHLKTHENLPDFEIQNIEVLGFENGRTETPKYTLYQCGSCKITVYTASSAARHRGSKQCRTATGVKWKCKRCGLLIHKSKINSHHAMHRNRPDFKRENFEIVTFDRDTNLESAADNSDDETTYPHFQCSKCSALLTSGYVARVHLDTCADDCPKVKCAKCGHTFLKRTFAKHLRKHEANPDMCRSNMKIIVKHPEKVRPQRDAGAAEAAVKKYTLYQCAKCKLCWASTKFLSWHVARCGTDKKKKCPDCGFYFTLKSFQKCRPHSLHHFKKDFTRNNIRVVPFNAGGAPDELYKCSRCNVVYESLNDIESHKIDCPPRDVHYCLRCDRLFAESRHSCDNKNITIVPFVGKSVDVTGDVSERPAKKYILYRCAKCDKCVHNYFNIKRHKHNCVSRVAADCRRCGLKFTCNGLTYIHMNFHKNYDFTIENTALVSFHPNYEGDKRKRDSVTELPPRKVAKLAEQVADTDTEDNSTCDENYTKKPSANNYDNALYKCKVCDVFFICYATYIKHAKKPHNTCVIKTGTQCQLCGFKFSKISLARHLYIHHEKKKMNREDFVLINHADDTEQLRTDCADSNDSSMAEENAAIAETSSANDENSSSASCHKCKMCDEVFATARALNIHVNLDHLDCEIDCMFCEQSFNISIMNKIHLQMNEQGFKCCICEERVAKHDVRTHVQKHFND